MLVTCPVCDDAGIERVPSAQVRIPRAAGRESAAPEPAGTGRAPPAQARTPGAAGGGSAPPDPADAESAPRHDVVAGMPEAVMSKLREIVRNTENVGRRFPEEARKIHYNEAPARSIR